MNEWIRPNVACCVCPRSVLVLASSAPEDGLHTAESLFTEIIPYGEKYYCCPACCVPEMTNWLLHGKLYCVGKITVTGAQGGSFKYCT